MSWSSLKWSCSRVSIFECGYQSDNWFLSRNERLFSYIPSELHSKSKTLLRIVFFRLLFILHCFIVHPVVIFYGCKRHLLLRDIRYQRQPTVSFDGSFIGKVMSFFYQTASIILIFFQHDVRRSKSSFGLGLYQIQI